MFLSFHEKYKPICDCCCVYKKFSHTIVVVNSCAINEFIAIVVNYFATYKFSAIVLDFFVDYTEVKTLILR